MATLPTSSETNELGIVSNMGLTLEHLVAIVVVTAALYLAVKPLWEDVLAWRGRRGCGEDGENSP